jgi:hypothetical protein
MILEDAITTNNVIQGNLIGLNAAGTAAISNAWSGIEIYNGPSGNIVGGGPGARNFISGNGNYGISINAGSTANQIVGNTIGLNLANSAAVPNQYSGIVLFDGAQANVIGGITFGNANLIAGNLSDAVSVFDPATTGNSVQGNSMFGNSGVGIGLYSAANNSAVPPSLSSASVTTVTTVSGSLNSAANSAYQLDFYSSPAPASSAQGRTWLGSRQATTGAGGSVSFTMTFGALVPAGRVITATATDSAGNTSEMSFGATVSLISSVNDGIPDAWRALYFGGVGTSTNNLSCAACDADGDGVSNLQEFLANTNPTNKSSALKLVALPVNGSNDRASFNSATGTVYRIEARDDLGAGVWSIIADQILGTGATILVNDPAAAVLPRRFYRAEVVW